MWGLNFRGLFEFVVAQQIYLAFPVDVRLPSKSGL